MHTNKKKKQNLLCKLLWNLLLNPLNLTWSCTKVSRNILGHFLWKPVEPDLPLHQTLPGLLRNLLRTAVEPCWTWPGACNSAHRSDSALKAPLFYAVGKRLNLVPPKAQNSFWTFPRNRKWHLSKSTTAAWLTLPALSTNNESTWMIRIKALAWWDFTFAVDWSSSDSSCSQVSMMGPKQT